jgi:hypothetical protein
VAEVEEGDEAAGLEHAHDLADRCGPARSLGKVVQGQARDDDVEGLVVER